MLCMTSSVNISHSKRYMYTSASLLVLVCFLLAMPVGTKPTSNRLAVFT